MSYSEAKRRQITRLALDALQAAEDGNFSKVNDIGEQLFKIRRSNPDWVGTTMQLAGAGMQLLPDPRAKAVGFVLTNAGRLFKGRGSGTKLSTKLGEARQ